MTPSTFPTPHSLDGNQSINRASLTISSPAKDSYIPDLHHLKYELEEGTTLDGRPVRFGYNPLEFEHFSWRGYAQMSSFQVGFAVPALSLGGCERQLPRL